VIGKWALIAVVQYVSTHSPNDIIFRLTTAASYWMLN